MLRRLSLFIAIFTIMNLIFIPLLSLYGLRVCPVLSIPGFRFGCYYSALYIVLVNIFNSMFVFFLCFSKSKARPIQWMKANRTLAFASSYFLATATALILLQILLDISHLTSSSRAPEILGIASLLLGLTQSYGLNWVLIEDQTEEKIESKSSFQQLWLRHVCRTLLPIAVVIAAVMHFLISQSVGFNEGRTAPVGSHDDLITQTCYVVGFLFLWLLITFTFHFLSERTYVQKVQLHLQHLNELDVKFRTRLNHAWGLWAALFDQLNSFSKILGERTRLLKSFSRFVTAGVAEKALHKELDETTGSMRELTVLMSDIRNFTSMSETLAPSQVVLLLNEYFAAMLDVMAESQISVDKFIGDGILAYVDPEEGSVPDAIAENTAGVDSALAMIARLKELNVKLLGLNLPEVKIGIGLYRGPVIIGLIGSAAKLQHTIIGDTVNRTARLESLCKELGVSVVISYEVWNSLSPDRQAQFKSFGKQSVKGIAEAFEVFGGPIRS